ncbi:electron transfer flavoprotein subunit beta/FixA family protein [Mesoterricola silvestris]|uniref:Electron transfer flavoprotein subunit beta n=1 Tax=Mesoterricola silvestris TaxID=2927979 RepID=A0AA48GJH4_9BACT|nr:electron transfer flavoprotein subunit beta/FixA family protein [Mesoterricola silvestris]BDU72447.1 electron transfer flavoprotein subunit beta [Mesoterricola silvestris]
MKILVALKQVPDTETKIRVAADGKSLDAGDVKWITSPYDEYALEEALRLKESAAAEVTAVSVGGDKAKDILRNALALGADQAVLVKSAETGDPLAVARTLAAFAQDKGFDLILLGNKGFGGDNACVGPMLAELLGLAQANVVTKLELSEGRFKAEREGDADSEVLEGSLPAVVTAQRGLNEPRYANLKGIMAAKKKTIEEVEGAAVTPAVTTVTLALPPSRPEGRKLEGDAAAQAAALLGLLRDEAKVL